MEQKRKNAIAEALIREIAVVLKADPSSIRTDTPLHDLGMTSMDFVELLVFIEKEYGVRLIESELSKEHFQAIDSLAEWIAGY